MEFNLETIIAIATTLTSLGLFTMFKTLIKEVKEAVKVINEAKADGNISEKEMDLIAKESMEVIEQVIKIGYLLKKVFKNKIFS